jgi:hypothetical protein
MLLPSFSWGPAAKSEVIQSQRTVTKLESERGKTGRAPWGRALAVVAKRVARRRAKAVVRIFPDMTYFSFGRTF